METACTQSLAIIAVLVATAYASECPPDGIHYIPHEKDCGLYYECKYGVKTEKECHGGLSFDPVNSICSWPPRSECAIRVDPPDEECPSASSIEVKRMPHDCSCVKYYECIRGLKVVQECSNGTGFDYLRGVCVDVDKARCYSKDVAMMAQADSDCPATGNSRVPHETDCNLYYNCENGMKYIGKCFDGHYFNPTIQQCDLADNVNCNSRTPLTTTPRLVDVDECPICNCDCTIRFPHTDCSLYYECNNGTKTVHECPEGLRYNPVTNNCDWPDAVNCTVPVCTVGNKTHHECRCDKYYECQDVGWVVESCPKGEEFDYVLNKCVPEKDANCWPPKDQPEGCMEACGPNESKIVVHENCTQYCQCENGNMTIVTCEPNMYYNPDKRICDWPESIRNLTCIPFPCRENSTVPHECDCSLFYECRNGLHVRKECSSDTEYNYETQRCLQYEDSHCYKEVKGDSVIESEGCLGTCPKLSPSDRSFVLPHMNCTKFCRCGAGAPYIVHCRPGLHFSEERGVCTEPAVAKCNTLYMYGFDERDSTLTKRSVWQNMLPFFNN